ncbi:glycoside hydrolase [Astrocystis sublimbata]|nr:glycoside hydrolase [Astrocystis sublimbata]
MRYSIALIGSALVGVSNAHYVFGRLILDGKWTDTFEYVREIAPEPVRGSPEDWGMPYPLERPDHPDMRCGRNASLPFAPVKTATVNAGDRVGFGIGGGSWPGDKGATMFHAGPAFAWLSKAPTNDLQTYAGDGDWFKILSVTGRTEQSMDYSLPENEKYYDEVDSVWGTLYLDSYNFTIPKTTPPGHYLLRYEHIRPGGGGVQWYVNCAHVEIVNTNTDKIGTPGPMAKIPGVYTKGQPDLWFSSYDPDFNIDEYKGPEPEVWEG